MSIQFYSSQKPLSPLIDYHEKMKSTIRGLSVDGFAFKTAKKIALIAIAPFAYFALSCLALIGLTANYFQKKFHVISSEKDKVVKSDSIQKNGQNKEIDQTEKSQNLSTWNEVKKNIIQIINNSRSTDLIKSAKLLVNIKLKDKEFNRDFIIKKDDLSSFDTKFLNLQIEKIVEDAKDFFSCELDQKPSFSWHAFLHINDKEYSAAHGYDNPKKSTSGNGTEEIEFVDLDEYFQLVLKQCNRKVENQLDPQGYFI